MLCLVRQADSVILEVEIDSKAKGKQCLDKVCEVLGIIESDYMGLQYAGPHGEKLWLNLRNQLRKQLPGPPPYRLDLRVKFFVPPHLILQDVTRYVYVSIESDRTAITQICQDVLKEHILLRGIKTNAAIYEFLKEVSEIDDFGMEQYFVKNRNGETFRIGVGPTGILIHDLNLRLKHNITYASIHLATHSGRCFFLTFLNHSGESQPLGFKLENCHSASALYRAVTEKHAFYSCETVRNAVTSQYIRDLKGTIASLFNENTALGKNYVFDIQRTCREVYDHTRRVMYQVEDICNKKTMNPSKTRSMDELNNLKEKDCQSASCKLVQEQLATFQDSMLCRVCMDLDISTVFFPCRHVACCSTCAPLCLSCPLCRSTITETQHVYLPYTGRKTSKIEENV
nr:E3 ubiquitin-protein ligase MYLIP [Parasteatoda tepidariorum]